MCEEEEEASTRLAQMQQLVRQAEFEAAERVGNLGEISLAVAKEALVNRRTLFEGAQASVFRAEWRDVTSPAPVFEFRSRKAPRSCYRAGHVRCVQRTVDRTGPGQAVTCRARPHDRLHHA